ncbi:type II toxin-antitoxin system HipA family toxin [Pseudaquabacterium rugosum]|uniref:HipA domain-containing protein n=1 Tax=Pseudaquabacterium rugosum TaxID=2984194 RepID=A0ABU9BA75_9BURK
MTRRAPVYRWIVDPRTQQRQPVRVGELTQEDTRWEFLYDADYLARGPAAWELDPSVIRNKQRAAFTRVGSVPFPVFCDVALSGWSLDALRKRAGTLLGSDAARSDEPWGWWERLLYAPADGFGALFVGHLDDKPDAFDALTDALKSVTKASLAHASRDSSSGAMGGERPKVSLYVDPGHGAAPRAVLLKFAQPSERADTVVAEATALTLAAELGLRVPAHRVECINDAPALSIDRFDRGVGSQGIVHHCVSAATALDLMPGSDVEDARRSYVKLRSKLKRPGDAQELYARVVLNAVVGNTDDHPWNTSLLQVGLGEWALSPLYDVLPFFERAGVPAFKMDITRHRPSRAATRVNLLAAGQQLAGLEEAQAMAVVDRTLAHVRGHWRRVFIAHSERLPDTRPDDWARVFEHEWLSP